MNYVFFLDAQAGELEKILSGTKSMLVKEFDPACAADRKVTPGDDLYFLKNKGDCELRVKATISRVLSFTTQLGEDLTHVLKEMQPKLQLTEEQYNEWSVKGQVLFIEFCSAQKIDAIQVASNKIMDRSANGSHWIGFEELSQST